MGSRYVNRTTAVNKDPLYKKSFEDRGISKIAQYKTAKLNYPTDKELESLNFKQHVWKAGDKYYKLAGKYYSDPSAWWVIAWINRKPTEAHLTQGDVLLIPVPLDSIESILIRNKV